MEKITIVQKFLDGVSTNKKEFVILTLILLIGAFLRLYKIDQYMTFLGDEGRDVIVVRRLLVNLDPILVGPGTSIGNMYLGPLYYYMMAPALFLANFSPVGPAVQVAILSVITIGFVWWVGKEWFGKVAGLSSAFLYAISPTVIIYSRSSWNPNIMPFFALLAIYSIWKVWNDNNFKWLIITGISYAFVLQSHYLGLLLIPALVLFWILALIRSIRSIRNFLKYSLIGLLLFLFLMSPLVIFDARHGWRNFAAMKKFFSERQETVSIKPWNSLPKIPLISQKTVTSLLAGRFEKPGKIISFGILDLSILVFIFRKKLTINQRKEYLLLFCWISFALIGLGLYKQEIYDHYYGFFFAAPFLLVGGLLEYVTQNSKHKIITYCLVSIALVYLLVINLSSTPIRFPPNRQLQRAVGVAKKISEKSNNNKFNLAVVAERNYEDGYKYFLLKNADKVIDIDSQLPDTIQNQLFVVCEMPKDKCDPTHSSKAEVANFGWSKIENQWNVEGVEVYKLVHTK